MIILASSSITRAAILREFGIEFTQVSHQYDETKIKKLNPLTYSQNVVNEKAKQFFAKFSNYDRVLFADSSVICKGEILGKAKTIQEAKRMLDLQSNSTLSVYTAMKFISKHCIMDSLSTATYTFGEFDESDLNEYLKSNLWQGKAGAIMVEGFCEKYILSSTGSKQTAMGLDIDALKVVL